MKNFFGAIGEWFKKIGTTLVNIWNIPELRTKILFTLFIILLYRVGASIPVPFIDTTAIDSLKDAYSGTMFQYLNLLSGDAFSKATLFALSISPYITSTIVMQLLCVAIPKLEKMSQEEDGKEKLTQWTRVLTVALAIVTSIGYYVYIKNTGLILADHKDWFSAVVMIACYSAGGALIMWLAEKIDNQGIGNGISLILFANILAAFPAEFGQLWSCFTSWSWDILVGVAGVLLIIATITFMVFFTESERRIPVTYAKRVVGRKMYGGQNTNLPLKMNMNGVMPIIFASSIVSIPATIGTLLGKTTASKGFWGGVLRLFNYTSFLYIAIFLVLLVAFAYFYIAISFNPVEVANNLKKNGGSVPGQRPGKPTADFIAKILHRITFIDACFLCIVAGVPMLITAIANACNYTALNYLAFGGSSLLIVVGVAIETARTIEAQMTMRHFKGFLE